MPLDEKRTRVMSVRRLPPGMDCHGYAKESEGSENPVLAEDKIVVESQTGPVDLIGEERSVQSDAPTVAFRAWYRSLLQESKAKLRAVSPAEDTPRALRSLV